MSDIKEVYITVCHHWRYKDYGIVTTNLNSSRYQSELSRTRDKQPTICQPNTPKEYYIEELAGGNPHDRILLKSEDNIYFDSNLKAIINVIKKYGVEPGGKLMTKLVWKNNNGHLYLDEV